MAARRSTVCREVIRSGRWPLAASLLFGCSLLTPPDERPAPPDLTFQHLTAQQYKAGLLDWRGTFQTLAYERTSGRVESETIALLPVSGGAAGSHIKAARGHGNLKSGVGEFEGGVTYDGHSADHGETSACSVNFNAHTAHGDRPAEMFGEGYHLVANGFDSTFGDPVQIQLNGGVHAVVDDPGDAR